MIGCELAYSGLKESERVISYDKATVRWMLNNYNKAMSIIASHGRGNINEQDRNDIYQDAVLYFAQADDYDINKAIDRGHNNTVPPIEGYVGTCLRHCVDRYVTREKSITSVYERDLEDIDEDHKAVNRIKKYDKYEERKTIDELCREYTPIRYIYGVDIYQLIYIKIVCRFKGIDKNIEQAVLFALDIDKDSIEAVNVEDDDSPIYELMLCISKSDTAEVIQTLENYVYGYKYIRKALGI